MNKQNMSFFLLSIVVVFFIVLVGVFLAEKMVWYALFSFVVAGLLMGYGFYLKRKWNSQT